NVAFTQNLAILAAGGVAHEMLDAEAVRRRFPAFAMTDGADGAFIPDGGMVDADASTAPFREGARKGGAAVRGLTRVAALERDGDDVRLTTDDGSIVEAGHVVIAGGAWTTELLSDLSLPIRVTRQAWYEMRPADPAAVSPDHIPVWCDYDTMYYGF